MNCVQCAHRLALASLQTLYVSSDETSVDFLDAFVAAGYRVCAPPLTVACCLRHVSRCMLLAPRVALHVACATCRVACCLRDVSRCMLLARRVALHASCATCRVAFFLRDVSPCMLRARVRHSGNARPRPRPRCACRSDGYRPATAHCAVHSSGRQCTHRTHRSHRSHPPVARTGRTHRYRFSDFLSPRAPVLTALPIPHKLLGPIEQALR
jgi:hypothetical protein